MMLRYIPKSRGFGSLELATRKPAASSLRVQGLLGGSKNLKSSNFVELTVINIINPIWIPFRVQKRQLSTYTY